MPFSGIFCTQIMIFTKFECLIYGRAKYKTCAIITPLHPQPLTSSDFNYDSKPYSKSFW